MRSIFFHETDIKKNLFDLFKKGKYYKAYKILDTEGLKNILFPVLEKHYPKDALEVLRSDNFLLGGTPYFTYIFLLQKYEHLNCNSNFSDMTMIKKLEYFITDRGAGNGTAFNQKEKENMLKAPINNYNDIILTIIDCEQSRDEGRIGYPWDLKKFSEIASEIEKAYLKYRGIESIE